MEGWVGGWLAGLRSLGLGSLLTSLLQAPDENLGLALRCPVTYLGSQTMLAGLGEAPLTGWPLSGKGRVSLSLLFTGGSERAEACERGLTASIKLSVLDLRILTFAGHCALADV